MLKALIFDFDGLILDTETPEYIALNEAYAEFGQTLSIETFGQAVGAQYGQKFDPFNRLEELTGRKMDAAAFWEKTHQRRLDLIDQSPLLPGVEDLIRTASARGLKLAVASSSPHAWVDGYLKQRQLYEFFDVVKCKEDVVHIKPAPDLFLAAQESLNVKAEEAVIFEDSLNGVIAAQRAGIRVIAVPNPMTEHMHADGNTPRLGSLADFSLDDLPDNL